MMATQNGPSEDSYYSLMAIVALAFIATAAVYILVLKDHRRQKQILKDLKCQSVEEGY